MASHVRQDGGKKHRLYSVSEIAEKAEMSKPWIRTLAERVAPVPAFEVKVSGQPPMNLYSSEQLKAILAKASAK